MIPAPDAVEMDTEMEVDNPTLQDFRQQWRRERGLPAVDDGDPRYRQASEASSWTMQRESSLASTAGTIRGTPDGSWPPDLDEYLPADDRMEMEPRETSQPSTIAPIESVFVIATDFGTTFSSVAFAKRTLGQVEPQVIFNYPDDPMTNGKISFEVPTESWYPDIANYREHLDEAMMTSTDEVNFRNILDDDDDDDEIDDLLPYVRNGEQSRGHENEDLGEDLETSARETAEYEEDGNGPAAFLWGYETQDIKTQAMMRFPGVDRIHFRRVARSKLMLDDSELTQKVRDNLRPILNQLKRRGIIRKDEDVIADYLSRLFTHAKGELLKYGFSESDSVEHVLCVPNIWSSKACRTMQRAMETAIRRSGLGSLENLFIVAEPEAAATFVLHNNINFRIKPGETFVIIDAGGGTVDATTYTVTNEDPLRLKREAVEPGGGLFGSSYLNEAFREYLTRRLAGELYLNTERSTLEDKIDEAMIDFENRMKRSVNLCDDKTKTILMAKIQGLRRDPDNPDNGFVEDHAKVSRGEMNGIFRPPLDGITQLMKSQIRLAIDAGLHIQKVILIGGFAGSVTLREYLKAKLRKFSRKLEDPIELFAPDSCFETAVALGAVLRALEKDDGPNRITQSSYGFLRTEPHEPKTYAAHKEVRPTIDKLDGGRYVRHTIDWLVKKGDELPPYHEFHITVIHTFPTWAKHFRCEEVLYVSDTSTESHYRVTHPKNKGAEVAGRIVADMTFLKTSGRIKPTLPDEGTRGKPHYKVEFELVMIIGGRNLRYESRYPAGGPVRGQGQTCIAAAFEPGTS